jgi:Spy/CpxP family protein refolding chaperone
MAYGVQSASSQAGSTQTSSAQTSSTQGPRNPFADPNGPFANLDLTSQQQTQIAQIFSQSSSSGQQQSWSQIVSQINAVLTSTQQQTLQSDVQTLQADHHHGGGHHGDGGGSSNPLAQLDLTSAQQTQIGQIIQSGQASGDSASDELSQIDNVLTPAQQQKLVSLFSSSSTTGSSTPSSEPYVISTSA